MIVVAGLHRGALRMLAGAAIVGGLVAGPAHGAACSARSGPRTVPLVELYTSEGCSSCPPADRWLSADVRRTCRRARAIPLAFHVDYWDRLGWKDRFAAAGLHRTAIRRDAREPRALRLYAAGPGAGQGLSGMARPRRPRPRWLRRARSPRAPRSRSRRSRSGGSIAVKATARVPSGADRKGAVLYVALADSGLASDVKAGENAGARLAHDHVVRLLARRTVAGRERRHALGRRAAAARRGGQRVDGRRLRPERRRPATCCRRWRCR